MEYLCMVRGTDTASAPLIEAYNPQEAADKAAANASQEIVIRETTAFYVAVYDDDHSMGVYESVIAPTSPKCSSGDGHEWVLHGVRGSLVTWRCNLCDVHRHDGIPTNGSTYVVRSYSHS